MYHYIYICTRTCKCGMCTQYFQRIGSCAVLEISITIQSVSLDLQASHMYRTCTVQYNKIKDAQCSTGCTVGLHTSYTRSCTCIYVQCITHLQYCRPTRCNQGPENPVPHTVYMSVALPNGMTSILDLAI